MEKKFKIALIQLQVKNDKIENIKNAVRNIEIAAKNHAKIIALPECFNAPLDLEQFHKYCEEIPNGETTQTLSRVCKENKIYLIGGSIPEKEGNHIYNTCLVFDDQGNLIGKHRKMHLFDAETDNFTFKESNTVSPGNDITVLNTPYCKIGICVCHDVRFPELAMIYQKEGCEMIFYPSAFNIPTGQPHWELLMRSRALDNQVYVAGISIAHDENSSYKAWGHSMIVDPFGDVLAKAEFDESIIYADIDLVKLQEIRRNIPYLTQKRNDIYELQYKKN